jgi:hypothetical protein
VAAWAGGMDIEKLKAHGRWRSDAIKASMTASLDIKLSVTFSMQTCMPWVHSHALLQHSAATHAARDGSLGL